MTEILSLIAEQEKFPVKGISRSEYSSIHSWIRKNFGSAQKCEGSNCTGPSKRIEWALLKGKKYERKRENFIQLCKSCHVKYDATPEGRKRTGEAHRHPRIVKFDVKCKGCENQVKSSFKSDKFCPECRKERNKTFRGNYEEQNVEMLKEKRMLWQREWRKANPLWGRDYHRRKRAAYLDQQISHLQEVVDKLKR